MNVNMFSEMLFGKDPAEVYIESEAGKTYIYTNSCLAAVLQVLIDKNVITENELNEYQKKFEELYKEKIREEFKKLQEQ